MKQILGVCAAVLALGMLEAFGQNQSDELISGEWQFSPFATYVDKSGDKWGLGASLTYYLTDHIGIGGATFWTDFDHGTFFDNAEAEAYYRFGDFNRIVPYAVASLGYQFDSGYWFETFGGGVNFRAMQQISPFADIQYRIADNDHSQNGIFLRLGVRISF